MPDEPTVPAPLDPEHRFAEAVAHWNAERFWDAHEAWEHLWHDCYDDHKRWIQGLIQYAAAFVHFDRGFFASGFARLMVTATEKVTDYEGPLHDLDWAALQADLVPWLAYGKAVAAGAAFPEAPAPYPILAWTGPPPPPR